MKKLIQICTVLSLVVVFSVVAVSAQTTNKRYEANVPFDFNIGQKTYQAGSYVIKVTKNSNLSWHMTIEDKDSNVLQTILGLDNGRVAKAEPQLVFNRYENQRFLAGVLSVERGVFVTRSRAEKQVARVLGRSDRATVAVRLEE